MDEAILEQVRTAMNTMAGPSNDLHDSVNSLSTRASSYGDDANLCPGIACLKTQLPT